MKTQKTDVDTIMECMEQLSQVRKDVSMLKEVVKQLEENAVNPKQEKKNANTKH